MSEKQRCLAPTSPHAMILVCLEEQRAMRHQYLAQETLGVSNTRRSHALGIGSWHAITMCLGVLDDTVGK